MIPSKIEGNLYIGGDMVRENGGGKNFKKALDVDALNGFVLMPYSLENNQNGGEKNDDYEWQLNFFHILLFAINDAFYQNYYNNIIRDYKPIILERADTGAGLSVDLLDNVFRKIDHCHFCVADLSEANLNVSMEMGYAFAKSKPVIQVEQIDQPTEECAKKNFSDLTGRLFYSVEFKKLTEQPLWKKLSLAFLKQKNKLYHPTEFFYEMERKIMPFSEKENDQHLTFLGAWIEKHKITAKISEIEVFEEKYEEFIVKQLYPTVKPVWEKLDPSGTEVQYNGVVYSSRDDADFSTVLSSARRRIRILTTNLQGLRKYLGDMDEALDISRGQRKKDENVEPLKVEILTLDPESEFVNARGKLIGREISEFRKEMKESLNKFKTELKSENGDVNIRIYREFPTQITYIIDNYVYSFVVSVNHQSRYNLVTKIEKGRRGVENSFYQHWDTIWARALDTK